MPYSAGLASVNGGWAPICHPNRTIWFWYSRAAIYSKHSLRYHLSHLPMNAIVGMQRSAVNAASRMACAACWTRSPGRATATCPSHDGYLRRATLNIV